jgi:hypothetical protein
LLEVPGRFEPYSRNRSALSGGDGPFGSFLFASRALPGGQCHPGGRRRAKACRRTPGETMSGHPVAGRGLLRPTPRQRAVDSTSRSGSVRTVPLPAARPGRGPSLPDRRTGYTRT